MQHDLWYKRHPDYEGIESYVRFYLPENAQVVYAILGLYAGIATYFVASGAAGKRKEVHERTLPTAKPDYHTALPEAAGGELPPFGSDAWIKHMETPGNMDAAFAGLGSGK